MKIKILAMTVLLTMGILVSPLAYGQAPVPTLSLKESIPIAEDALAKEKVDIAHYFLYSVILTHAEKGFYWYYTFRPKEPSEYGQIYVRVYMSGETEISAGELSRRAY